MLGIGRHSRAVGEVLTGQDRLYTVIERAVDGDRAAVVGVLTGYLYAPDDPEAVLSALTDARTCVVMLTITRSRTPNRDRPRYGSSGSSRLPGERAPAAAAVCEVCPGTSRSD